MKTQPLTKPQLFLCLAIGNLAGALIWNPPSFAWDLGSWVTDSINGIAQTVNPPPPTQYKAVIGGYEVTQTMNPALRAGATQYSNFGELSEQKALKLDYLSQPQTIKTLRRFLGSPAYLGQNNTWYYDSPRGQIIVYLNGDSATWEFAK